ncbi:MAG: BatA and WFA domain-containing protein [Nanoarchaeota archaeon]
MVAFNPTDYFLNPSGLYALFSLIPLLLLYLVKPKPQEKKIPSLMFFLKDIGSENSLAFFRRLYQDWLFVLQLLTLILIAAAIAKPYLEISEKLLSDNSIIVLDASASMQTKYEGGTRFDEAVKQAKKNLGSKNTLILVKSIPEVVYQDEDASTVRTYLNGLKPSESTTSLYTALLTAADYVKGDNTQAVILSDFIDTDTEADLNTAKRALQSKGAAVEFIPIASPVRNIGIIDADVGEQKTAIRIKNYNDEAQTVMVNINDLHESITIPASSIEIFTFTTPSSISKLTLDVEDDFNIDNNLYLSAPSNRTLRVLFITNQEDKLVQQNIYIAFDVIGKTTSYKMKTEVLIPPKAHSIDQDIILIDRVDKSLLLPGTIKSIKERVQNGGTLIILPQEDLGAIDFQGLLPVIIKNKDTVGSDIENVLCPTTQKSSNQGEKCLTKDIQFGHANEYLAADPVESSTVIAKSKKDGGPLIVYKKQGAGGVIYYGLYDEKSSFRTNIYYPIFWKRIFDLITATQDVHDLNKKAGSSISLGKNEAVKTPDGRIIRDLLRFENTGTYTLKDKVIAVNLLSEQESDVSGKFTQHDDDAKQAENIDRKVNKEVTEYVVYGLLALLFIELFLIKFRGDL